MKKNEIIQTQQDSLFPQFFKQKNIDFQIDKPL